MTTYMKNSEKEPVIDVKNYLHRHWYKTRRYSWCQPQWSGGLLHTTRELAANPDPGLLAVYKDKEN